MLHDIGLQQRQRVMLGLVGGPRHGPDDQIGIDEFDHVAFVAGEEPRPGLVPVAHIGIPE